MKVSEDMKSFLKENSQLINNNEFDEVYELYRKGSFSLRSALTEVFYAAGIDPLPYMKSVPLNFASYVDSTKNVTIPGNIKTVGAFSFTLNINLAEVDIKEGVEIIKAYAFSRCHKLEKIYLPSTLLTIEKGAFGGCVALKDVYYGGTPSQWSRINIDDGNDALYLVTVHYANDGK